MNDWIVFTGIAALLAITPGSDTALVTRNLIARGASAAMATVAGISLGCAVHAIASALGLFAILAHSAELYRAVKLIGAAYLVYLGLQSLYSWWRQIETAPAASPAGTGRRSFAEGLLTNLSNPKVALFYITFLPQFIHPTDPPVRKALLLAAIHLMLGVAWLSVYIFVLGRARRLLLRSSIRSRLEAVTGALLLGLGVRVALDRR